MLQALPAPQNQAPCTVTASSSTCGSVHPPNHMQWCRTLLTTYTVLLMRYAVYPYPVGQLPWVSPLHQVKETGLLSPTHCDDRVVHANAALLVLYSMFRKWSIGQPSLSEATPAPLPTPSASISTRDTLQPDCLGAALASPHGMLVPLLPSPFIVP